MKYRELYRLLLRYAFLIVFASSVSSCATLAGCDPTGDPTEGGLYCWDRSKANARQKTLHSEANKAELELNTSLEMEDNLKLDKSTLISTIAEAERRFNVSYRRNQVLAKQLRELKIQLEANKSLADTKAIELENLNQRLELQRQFSQQNLVGKSQIVNSLEAENRELLELITLYSM